MSDVEFAQTRVHEAPPLPETDPGMVIGVVITPAQRQKVRVVPSTRAIQGPRLQPLVDPRCIVRVRPAQVVPEGKSPV
jgi:hypothetical protein